MKSVVIETRRNTKGNGSITKILLSTLYELDAQTLTYHTITTPEFDHAVRAVARHLLSTSRGDIRLKARWWKEDEDDGKSRFDFINAHGTTVITLVANDGLFEFERNGQQPIKVYSKFLADHPYVESREQKMVAEVYKMCNRDGWLHRPTVRPLV